MRFRSIRIGERTVGLPTGAYMSMIKTFGIACVVLTACGTDAPAVEKGPGAALKCTSSGKDAFDTYGADAFVAVNKKIIANTFAELGANATSNLGDSFNKIGTGNPVSTTDDA